MKIRLMVFGSFTNSWKPYHEVRASGYTPSGVLAFESHHDVEHALKSPSRTVKLGEVFNVDK